MHLGHISRARLLWHLLLHRLGAEEPVDVVDPREQHLRRQRQLLVQLDQPINESLAHRAAELKLATHVVRAERRRSGHGGANGGVQRGAVERETRRAAHYGVRLHGAVGGGRRLVADDRFERRVLAKVHKERAVVGGRAEGARRAQQPRGARRAGGLGGRERRAKASVAAETADASRGQPSRADAAERRAERAQRSYGDAV